MMDNINTKIWKYMLSEGVPLIHVKDLVKKHIGALELLPDTIDGKAQAMIDCEEFLYQLNQKE